MTSASAWIHGNEQRRQWSAFDTPEGLLVETLLAEDNERDLEFLSTPSSASRQRRPGQARGKGWKVGVMGLVGLGRISNQWVALVGRASWTNLAFSICYLFLSFYYSFSFVVFYFHSLFSWSFFLEKCVLNFSIKFKCRQFRIYLP